MLMLIIFIINQIMHY